MFSMSTISEKKYIQSFFLSNKSKTYICIVVRVLNHVHVHFQNILYLIYFYRSTGNFCCRHPLETAYSWKFSNNFHSNSCFLKFWTPQKSKVKLVVMTGSRETKFCKGNQRKERNMQPGGLLRNVWEISWITSGINCKSASTTERQRTSRYRRYFVVHKRFALTQYFLGSQTYNFMIKLLVFQQNETCKESPKNLLASLV